jgi:hypothetical protein
MYSHAHTDAPIVYCALAQRGHVQAMQQILAEQTQAVVDALERRDYRCVEALSKQCFGLDAIVAEFGRQSAVGVAVLNKSIAVLRWLIAHLKCVLPTEHLAAAIGMVLEMPECDIGLAVHMFTGAVSTLPGGSKPVSEIWTQAALSLLAQLIVVSQRIGQLNQTEDTTGCLNVLSRVLSDPNLHLFLSTPATFSSPTPSHAAPVVIVAEELLRCGVRFPALVNNAIGALVGSRMPSNCPYKGLVHTALGLLSLQELVQQEVAVRLADALLSHELATKCTIVVLLSSLLARTSQARLEEGVLHKLAKNQMSRAVTHLGSFLAKRVADTEELRLFTARVRDFLSSYFPDEFKCRICLDTYRDAVRVGLPGGGEHFKKHECVHMFCSECLSDHIASQVGNLSIRCPSGDCK